MLRGLIWRSHHEPGSCLIADLLKVPQTFLSVGCGEGRRMEAGIVFFVISLVPQKIPVCPGVEEPAVDVCGSLSDGKCDGTIRVERFDMPDQTDYFLICIISILSAL